MWDQWRGEERQCLSKQSKKINVWTLNIAVSTVKIDTVRFRGT